MGTLVLYWTVLGSPRMLGPRAGVWRFFGIVGIIITTITITLGFGVVGIHLGVESWFMMVFITGR
ncbi:uncharacterized protein K489DRAFT_374993 [Dissoconium aciculare CBS 342.82]|jgi:hypothetical protein|uniref:Uncharacterized protein n=1 Tax=Dissoconium aciculare CBS 342.82 TaxID=1314786 RepID=A0A6J3MG29_9PEZI|nr:uncharacterized protein K489DRAFT_374993 [Dissoconium aciculare CBS 342.82]KAF1826915.1 hypothetical protein K489DRAFT_374993 [Dissoconium aciculare CBS 342.82]